MKQWHILTLFLVIGVVVAIWVYQSKLATTTPQKTLESNQKTNLDQQLPEKVSIEGSDGVKLVGELYSPTQSKTGVILFHMLGGSKKDWGVLTEKLTENNLTVLAVDLRGHGESMGRNNDYQLMTEDALKWLLFFKDKIPGQEVFLIGASIGANLVVEASKNDSGVKKMVLLSPGLEYRGINIEGTITQLKVPILAVASKEDQYSFSSTRTLKEKNNSLEIIELENSGHGTRMLSASPNIVERIIDWLAK